MFPEWQAVLRSPAGDRVHQSRLAGAVPLYSAVLASAHPHVHTWQDAAASFVAVRRGTASREHLCSLLRPALEHAATQAPQGTAVVAVLFTLLHALRECGPSALAAAAEALLHALSARLSALAQAAPAQAAAPLFALLAAGKRVFSRTRDLAALCYRGDACAGVAARLARSWDALYTTHALSDRAALCLRHLSPAAAANAEVRREAHGSATTSPRGLSRSPPQVGAFLRGLGRLPPGEVARLGICPLQAPTPAATLAPVPLAVATLEGGSVQLSSLHVRALSRVCAMQRLCAHWGDEAGERAPLPLPVGAFALRALLDLADVVGQRVVLGGAAGRHHLRELWLREVTADAGTLREVRNCVPHVRN